MNGGPSGFQNAPVTRTFVIASALLTILFGVQGWSHMLGLSYQDIFEKFQLWRVISSVFAFSSTLELIFGLFLLYYFRVFERQIGSNKHSVFISFSVITSLLLEVVALSFLKGSSLSTLASGAYGLIFASFMPFYYDIPVSSQFPVFRINFTDKSFIYLAGLQLVLSSWKHSLIPSVCGLLAGALYRLNIFGIRKIKFPKAVASLFSCLSWPSSGSSPPHTPARRNIIRNVPSYVGHQMQGNYPSAAARTAVPEPPESSIAMLVSMGFDSNSARRALMQARNDINAATNILLETQSR